MICGKQYKSEADFLTGTRRWRACSAGHLWFNCACGTTLMIKKGKYDWYSPDKFLRDEARSVFNRLGGLKGLAPLPSSVMRLQQLAQGAETTPKLLADELRKEPLLAAQVLQMAERLRAVRNRTSPSIQAVEHAIVYAGIKTVGEFLASAALRSMNVPPSSFKVSDFWAHSYLVGSTTELLVHEHGSPVEADAAYLAGTLCNIGKLVSAMCFPDITSKIVHEVHSPTVLASWRAAERTFRFPDHSIIGEIGASLWGLPDAVMDATRLHHEVPDPSTNRPFTLFEIVSVANQLAHLVMMQPHCVEEPVLDAYRSRTKTSDRELKSILAAVIKIKSAIAA
jgi:HD-like signal output (HDOD) protein